MKIRYEFHVVDLDHVYRINVGEEDDGDRFVKFDFKGERNNWSKFFFETEEERTDYMEALFLLADIKEIEPDVIGKLK